MHGGMKPNRLADHGIEAITVRGEHQRDQRRWDMWAIAAVVLGLCLALAPVSSILALAAGGCGLRRARSHPRARGWMLAWVGIGLGLVGVIAFAASGVWEAPWIVVRGPLWHV